MTTRSNYWSCTKFANWLRGEKKPSSETAKGWRLWREASKAAHPFRYWLAEKALDGVQDFLNWPLDKYHAVRWYIKNRFVDKPHALMATKQHIKRGEWCDLSNRYLFCMFDSLVEFVECEKALMWRWCHKKDNRVPFWQRIKAIRFKTWRNKELGLEYLKWEISLTAKEDYGLQPTDEGYGQPTHQARAAQEILDLYTWWTEVYPNRQDIYDASGWSAYCDSKRAAGIDVLEHDDETPEMQQACNISHKKLQEIEKAYEEEDEAMMIRLIKVRRNLWT